MIVQRFVTSLWSESLVFKWHFFVRVYREKRRSEECEDCEPYSCGWTWLSPQVNLVKGCWLLYDSIVSVALPPLW
jgi:hypothetical protein